MADDSTRISPTSWYTGYVWYRHGLAPRQLVQRGGPALFWLVQPLMWVAAPFVGGITLERLLLQRHRILDRLLADAVESGEISKVYAHFDGQQGAQLAARNAGFATATLHTAGGWKDRLDVYVGRRGDILQVIDAQT